jgi:hypothetical protein
MLEFVLVLKWALGLDGQMMDITDGSSLKFWDIVDIRHDIATMVTWYDQIEGFNIFIYY